jgi:flap endonuclease-1
MAMYQFLISTQQIKGGFSIADLRDAEGNLTGHLLGLYNRSIMLMENGIRPCWVFDGKPPDAKIFVLRKRKERKENAEREKSEAKDEGDMEAALKFANQTVKIDKKMTDDAKKLIKLLGLPVIEAPSEAEATCAILAKNKLVDCAATEDMDTLCFGCPILIRDLSNKEANITEIKLEEVLKGLDINMEQFIDLCILCGCDYCPRIDNVGSIKAYNLIKEHETIENVIKYADMYNKDESHKKKLTYNKEEFTYDEARKLFKEPEVIETKDLKIEWGKPDVEGLKEFLVKEKNFSEGRIENAMKRLANAKSKANQSRLDNFFKPISVSQNSIKPGSKKLPEPIKAGNKKGKTTRKKK